jgi:2-polyprenyl-6-methoxyphenol hydroxylase-like FAD-dependent oxidoreductase
MTEQDRDHEVVVIGAGPTGAMAALELHRLGVPATLVDRLEAPHRQTRATAVLPRSLELLEAAGATEPIVQQSVHASGADVLSPDGAPLGGYHLDAVPSRYPWFAALPQWRTETVLRTRLEAHGGGVLRGVHVTGLDEHDDHVALTVERADGARERW